MSLSWPPSGTQKPACGPVIRRTSAALDAPANPSTDRRSDSRHQYRFAHLCVPPERCSTFVAGSSTLPSGRSIFQPRRPAPNARIRRHRGQMQARKTEFLSHTRICRIFVQSRALQRAVAVRIRRIAPASVRSDQSPGRIPPESRKAGPWSAHVMLKVEAATCAARARRRLRCRPVTRLVKRSGTPSTAGQRVPGSIRVGAS